MKKYLASLKKENPELSKEWDYEGNTPLTPETVQPWSHKSVWWICQKGHSWQAAVGQRHRGTGCPTCNLDKTRKNKNLAVLNPDLAKEWHPVKNSPLTPYNVMPGTLRKVWWQCKEGHEWETRVVRRAREGSGCPYCSRRKVNAENNLSALNPALASEWHPSKNLPLTTRTVTANSGKHAWWICKKGHEWRAIIKNRNKGTGCPVCAGRKVQR